uniref:Sulfotransferase domain-containing protein n=1 Tax=Noctiluca scintillans TaxID=2966 RepID=A0A7S1FFF0_NOCSC
MVANRSLWFVLCVFASESLGTSSPPKCEESEDSVCRIDYDEPLTMKYQREEVHLDAPPPKVLIWHLAKGGGATVLHMLRQALDRQAQQQMKLIVEDGFIGEQFWAPDYFRIGLAREPCSYYKSLFYEGNIIRNGFLHYAIKKTNREYLYDDVTRFSDWVEHVTATDRAHAPNVHGCGALSMRFWVATLNASAAHYVNQHWERKTADVKTWIRRYKPCPLADCAFNAPQEVLDFCQRDLAQKGQKLSQFDCWIRVESLFEDFDICMERYRQRGGTVRGYTHESKNVRNVPSCNSTVTERDRILIDRVDQQYTALFGYNGKCCSAS